jgi:Flp pilus assembly pilin Flp
LRAAAWRLWIAVAHGETGQDLVEYALLVVLIGLAVIATVDLFGHQVEKIFHGAEEHLEHAEHAGRKGAGR